MSAVEVVESVLHVCLSVCVSVCQLVLMVCVCRYIKAKGLQGEGTLQHGSREVRHRSGIFIHPINLLSPVKRIIMYMEHFMFITKHVLSSQLYREIS